MSNQQYTVTDTNRMSWEEFGNITYKLLEEIQNSQIHFDAVAPVLRNGAIPGTIIANKLEIITYLPIQVKYDYGMNKHVQMLPFYKPLTIDLGESPKILVTESNTFSGESAIKSAQIIKEAFPKAKLYYATITRVYRKTEITLPMYEKYFYGVMTNENFEADQVVESKLRLRPKITIFPWETEEKELKDINSFFNN